MHFLGPPGTGKSHLVVALGVEAVKADTSVFLAMLAELVDSMRKAEREGKLRERVKVLARHQRLTPAHRHQVWVKAVSRGRRFATGDEDALSLQPVGLECRRPSVDGWARRMPRRRLRCTPLGR